jgi:hypothetical protein
MITQFRIFEQARVHQNVSSTNLLMITIGNLGESES